MDVTSLPVWIALALALGIVVGDRLEPDPVALRALALAVAALGPIAARRAVARGLLAILLAGSLGAAALSERLGQAVAGGPAAGLELTIAARPCGLPPLGNGLVVCEAVVVDAGPRRGDAIELPPRLLISALAGSPEALALSRVAGARRIRARVQTAHPPEARNPGARDHARRLVRRGIGGRAYLADARLVVATGWRRQPLADPVRRAWAAIGLLRMRIVARLEAAGPGGALLAALAAGDRSGLDPAVRAELAGLGIAHLLAVSGLHVAIVVGLCYALARPGLAGPLTRAGVADPRPFAAALSLAGAFAYAALAGMGLPLRRALVVAGVLWLAFASGRRWPAGSTLAGAAVVLLAAEPAALFDPGAQLSFAAAGALMLGLSPGGTAHPSGRAARIVEGLRTSLRTSAIALAATGPILAAHGLVVTPFGLAVNGLAVPLTALLLLPAALLAVLVAAVAPVAVASPIVAVLAWPAERALVAATSLAERLPLDGSGGPLGPAGVCLGLLLGLAAIRLPGDLVRAAAVLSLSLWLRAGAPPPIEPLPPRIVAFDVGQGDALLVQGRRGVILVDAGRSIPGRLDMGARTVVPALAALGVGSLDLVIASHADVDHRGGLDAVLRRVPVGRLWLPAGGLEDPAFAGLRAVAKERAVVVEEIVADGRPEQRAGDLSIEVLWPTEHAAEASSNDGSIVVRVSVDGDAVLLTGDIGRSVERALTASGQPIEARILKVAHHGSVTSSGGAFLDAVGASIAIVSAGCGARSGLPASPVLDRLRERSIRVEWTGRDGAVVLPLGAARSDEEARRFGAVRKGCERASPRRAPVSCVAHPSACQ